MQSTPEKSGIGQILSPEGVLVLFWATFLDFTGILDLIPIIGDIITLLISLVGLLTLGVWSWFKTKGSFETKLRKNTIRQGLVFFFEGIIPFGSLVPGWIILVLATYMSKE